MLDRMSAISSWLASQKRAGHSPAGVRLGELRGWALLQIAGFAGAMPAVEGAVSAAVGVRSLPPGMGEALRVADLTIFRTGPEQFWIVGTGERLTLEAELRSTVAAAGGVVTDLSHSRTRLAIEGARARDVLAKEIAIDLAVERFAVGAFALCGFDRTPALLHRVAADGYEIIAMRTYALSVVQRLADAASEWGYEVA